MEMLIGFAAIYFWTHACVICFKKLQVSGYEKVVMIIAFVLAVLLFIGVASRY